MGTPEVVQKRGSGKLRLAAREVHLRQVDVKRPSRRFEEVRQLRGHKDGTPTIRPSGFRDPWAFPGTDLVKLPTRRLLARVDGSPCWPIRSESPVTRYKGSATYDDEIVIHTSILKLRRSLIQFGYQVFRESGNICWRPECLLTSSSVETGSANRYRTNTWCRAHAPWAASLIRRPYRNNWRS